MDKPTYNSLKEIIDYLYKDEQKNWEEADKPKLHIFNNIKKVAEWLAETEKDYYNEN